MAKKPKKPHPKSPQIAGDIGVFVVSGRSASMWSLVQPSDTVLASSSEVSSKTSILASGENV